MTRENAAAEEGRARLIHTHTHTYTLQHTKHTGDTGLLNVKSVKKKQSYNATCDIKR